jgi:hypothetical protein
MIKGELKKAVVITKAITKAKTQNPGLTDKEVLRLVLTEMLDKPTE